MNSTQYRLYIAIAVAGLVLLLLLASRNPKSTPPPAWELHPSSSYILQNDTLKTRLTIAEENFQRSLIKRKALIRQFGPTPDKILSYPQNREFYTLWDFFTPSFQCPYNVERVGVNGDGGKYVCGLSRIASKAKCVVYSFGVNGESSFEAELLERVPGCQVWGCDFSVTSFGPEIEHHQNLASRSHFFPFGLAGKSDHGPGRSGPPMYTLPELMARNGHSFIDVLKIDIEGAEFEALNELLKVYADRPLPFGQLQLEVHAWENDWTHEFPKFLKWWESLEKAGLRAFWTEPNLVYVNINRGFAPDLSEYAFINTLGHHELVIGL